MNFLLIYPSIECQSNEILYDNDTILPIDFRYSCCTIVRILPTHRCHIVALSIDFPFPFSGTMAFVQSIDAFCILNFYLQLKFCVLTFELTCSRDDNDIRPPGSFVRFRKFHFWENFSHKKLNY